MALEPTDTSSSSRWPSRREFVEKVLIVLGSLSAFVALGLLLWHGIQVILLLFAGLLLAVLFRSLASLLRRYAPVSERLSVGIVLLVLTFAAALGVWLAMPSSDRQIDSLTSQFLQALDTTRQRLSQMPYGDRILQQISPLTLEDFFGRQPSNIFGRITGVFSAFLGGLVNVLIVLLTGIYLAFNPESYIKGIIKLFPARRHQRVREVLETLGLTLRAWIFGRTIVGIVVGAATTIGLLLLNVPYAVPLGILAGLLNAVPNIGPLIAGVPAVLLALPQGFSTAGLVVLLYLVLQSAEGYILTPLVQERTISLPPVLVLSSQLLFGILFGFLGLLLAVPAFAVIYTLIQLLYVEDFLGNRVYVEAERQAQRDDKSEQQGES